MYRPRAAVLDSLIIGIAVGVLSWVFLMQPDAEATSLLVRLTSLAYPVTDLMLVIMAVRLLAGGGRRSASFNLLTGGLILLAVTDSLYGWFNLHDVAFDSGSLVEAGWLTYYLTVGACALHPSMQELATLAPRRKAVASRARLVTLAAAALAGPILLATNAALGRRLDTLPITLGTIAIIGLAFLRTGRGDAPSTASRGADASSGTARPAHRLAQPGPDHGPYRTAPGPQSPKRHHWGGHVCRSGRLQKRQRHPGTCSRGPASPGSGGASGGHFARRRHHRAHGWRRVRDPDRRRDAAKCARAGGRAPTGSNASTLRAGRRPDAPHGHHQRGHRLWRPRHPWPAAPRR